MNKPNTDFEFKSHFGWLVLGQLVFAFMFALIFASGFSGGGAKIADSFALETDATPG
jgi:hypothetical protein